jgi:hypothetical protein
MRQGVRPDIDTAITSAVNLTTSAATEARGLRCLPVRSFDVGPVRHRAAHQRIRAKWRDVPLRCILVARFGLQDCDCLAHRLR